MHLNRNIFIIIANEKNKSECETHNINFNNETEQRIVLSQTIFLPDQGCELPSRQQSHLRRSQTLGRVSFGANKFWAAITLTKGKKYWTKTIMFNKGHGQRS